MIRSITFKKNKKTGYIYSPKYKLVLKKKFKGWTREQIDEYIDKEIERTGSRYCLGRDPYEYFYKEVTDGYVNPQLVKNLGEKTITFDPDKINVIFGPNGCGKTTILKAIANVCLCGDKDSMDGYTNPYHLNPLCINGKLDDETKYNIDNYKQSLFCHKNDVDVDWDGYPTYFENLSGRRNTGTLGDLTGSLFQTSKDEFIWLTTKSQISLGQNTIYMIKKLVEVCSVCPTFEDFEKNIEEKKKNEPWYKTGKLALEYIKLFREKNGKMTLLLDEMDKSLDLSNTLLLYKDFLPRLVKKFNIQIILVSHSPLMLTNIIQNSPYYNFISIDKKYTKEMKQNFSGVSF